MTLSILIVDDHAGFRARARAMLRSEGFAVIAEASDGASAEATARAMRPDVVLLDLMLPDDTGFDVARRLAALQPMPAIVLVSSREAADYGSRVDDSPARGFLSKADLSGERLRALLTGR